MCFKNFFETHKYIDQIAVLDEDRLRTFSAKVQCIQTRRFAPGLIMSTFQAYGLADAGHEGFLNKDRTDFSMHYNIRNVSKYYNFLFRLFK